ncbi:MAG: hypothetical protein QNK83_12900 [Akkermansiaceae bacterium]|nr:hypothetical protein [Akkermansiaceae bacterium]MDB4454255.1 hypothetical protein [bacterium]MDB4569951.1 hypothetical protein [Akkermansiaceae bacterium]MDB4596771.1 hypothetical protein [Akkermansiaceae bacterium]MDB4779231.1 hypothetical protein [bacterium]
MKFLPFVFSLLVIGLSSCERHDWESKPGKPGTEELFKHAPVEKDGGEHKEESH